MNIYKVEIISAESLDWIAIPRYSSHFITASTEQEAREAVDNFLEENEELESIELIGGMDYGKESSRTVCYSVTIARDEDTGEFTAFHPELGLGVYSQENTPEEALESLKIEAEEYIELLKDRGMSIPPEKTMQDYI